MLSVDWALVALGWKRILRTRIAGRRTITRRRHHHAPLNLGNSQMSGEVQQVNGTDRTRHGKEVDLISCGEEHRDVPDGVVVQVDPNVGTLRIAILVMRVADMLPAGHVVCVPNVPKDARIEHSWPLKLEAVDGDAIDPGDHAAQAVVLVDPGFHHQHGMVKAELGARGGILPESFNLLREPVLLQRRRLGLSQSGRSGEYDRQERPDESHGNLKIGDRIWRQKAERRVFTSTQLGGISCDGVLRKSAKPLPRAFELARKIFVFLPRGFDQRAKDGAGARVIVERPLGMPLDGKDKVVGRRALQGFDDVVIGTTGDDA